MYPYWSVYSTTLLGWDAEHHEYQDIHSVRDGAWFVLSEELCKPLHFEIFCMIFLPVDPCTIHSYPFLLCQDDDLNCLISVLCIDLENHCLCILSLPDTLSEKIKKYTEIFSTFSNLFISVLHLHIFLLPPHNLASHSSGWSKTHQGKQLWYVRTKIGPKSLLKL